MARPNSRQTLKDYCLRALGQPVVTVNVEDSQVEDRIDDALQYFSNFHHDGGSKMYYSYPITQEDIDNKYILTDPIDPSIITINRVFQSAFNNATNNIFNIRYQMALTDFYGLRSGGAVLQNYTSTMQYLQTMEMILNPEKQVRFNRTTNKLHIDAGSADLYAGQFLLIEAYSVTDPEKATEIYSDQWLKRYTTAIIKKQWGINLSKYEGIPLPGGVVFNGSKILEDAKADIEKLEEEIEKRFFGGLEFFVG